MNQTSRLVEIAPSVGYGEAPADGWYPVADCPLLIVVGVTGVGKSTTIAALKKLHRSRDEKLRLSAAPAGNEQPSSLAEQQPDMGFTVLPDRRALTDDLIIARLQRADGVPVALVRDRGKRFEYTRRYRERFAGGMAHALAQLQIAEPAARGQLLFDGLRGANEVQYAAELLPRARFVALDAPDAVRVRRLLGRNDAFDQIGSGRAMPKGSAQCVLPVDGAGALFSEPEQAALLELVKSGQVSQDALEAKLQIVVEERRNYDPAQTLQLLRQLAPERSLILDTTRYTPAQAAQKIARFLGL